MLTPRDIIENAFIQPSIAIGPPTTNDSEPVTKGIRNINLNSFEICLQEWDYQDNSHIPETFSYTMVKKGTYNLDNGTKIDACSLNGAKILRTITLQQTYNRIPVILIPIITERDTAIVTGRNRDSAQNSFDYLLQEQQTTKTSHFFETVDYNAWEPSSTADNVTHKWFDLTSQTEFPDAPLFIAGMQNYNGVENATVLNQNLSRTTTQIKIEAEQSKDLEIDHATEKKITFTWDYGNTQNVSGFKFHLNGNQICETTNPNIRLIDCYAAQINDTMELPVTAVLLDETDGIPSNLPSLNPADYLDLFGMHLATFTWAYSPNQGCLISGFRFFNSDKQICEATHPEDRRINLHTASQHNNKQFQHNSSRIIRRRNQPITHSLSQNKRTITTIV